MGVVKIINKEKLKWWKVQADPKRSAEAERSSRGLRKGPSDTDGWECLAAVFAGVVFNGSNSCFRKIVDPVSGKRMTETTRTVKREAGRLESTALGKIGYPLVQCKTSWRSPEAKMERDWRKESWRGEG